MGTGHLLERHDQRPDRVKDAGLVGICSGICDVYGRLQGAGKSSSSHQVVPLPLQFYALQRSTSLWRGTGGGGSSRAEQLTSRVRGLPRRSPCRLLHTRCNSCSAVAGLPVTGGMTTTLKVFSRRHSRRVLSTPSLLGGQASLDCREPRSKQGRMVLQPVVERRDAFVDLRQPSHAFVKSA